MTDEEINKACNRMSANYIAHNRRNRRHNVNLKKNGITPFSYHISRKEKIQILSDWVDKYKDIDVFVETGTREGKTLLSMKDEFERLYSVEISHKWYNKSIKQMKRAGNPEHIKIEMGDSLSFIPKVLEEVNDRCFIFLDAHGKHGTPVLDELNIIFNHSIKDHVILIDDAYDFSRGHLNYPSIYQIRDLAIENGYNFIMENERAPEVMIIYPQ